MIRHIALVSIFIHCFNVDGYNLIQEYSGTSFFTGWDFYGFRDNLTWGNVTWVNQADATSLMLAYVNGAGNAILKVDNTTDVVSGDLRNSVRITTQTSYEQGTLWLMDALHLPYGCSVWPAFWSKGSLWPDDGEIDVVEGINLMTANQMVIHTLPGCTHASGTNETGAAATSDCSINSGCVVSESQPNSFAAGFADAGGGVWATQFDESGIFIWFWSRPNIPPSITQATSTIDISAWGPPSASYLSTTCNISEFFTPQNLVLDITLCGHWAGLPQTYQPDCGSLGPTGICYNDSVVGPGSPMYDNAYFEISYVKVYTNAAVAPTATATSTSASATALPDANKTPGSGDNTRPSNGMPKVYRTYGFFYLTMTLFVIFL